MQFRSSSHHFRRRAYSQIVSGVLLMLLGAAFLLSPLSARSQEPTPSAVAMTPTELVTVMTTAASAESTGVPEQPSPDATSPSNTTVEAPTEPNNASPTNIAAATSSPTDTLTLEPTELATPTLALTPTIEPTALVTPTLTLTPTTEPTALVTPTATLAPTASPLEEAPLTITMSAADEEAGPSQQTRLTAIVDSSSAAARTARVEVELDPRLEAISASASNGICTVDVPVVCTMSVQDGAPGVINIVAQVRADAPADGKLVSQAVARDDRHETAASDPVTIDVRGSGVAPQPLAPTTALSTSTPVPTALPTSTPAPSPTAVVAARLPIPAPPDSRAVAPTATTGTIAQVATASPRATPAAVTTTSGVPPTQAPPATSSVSTPSRVPMPDDVFTAPQGENQQLPTTPNASATNIVQATPESPVMQSNNLPNTASQAPLLGWSSMLLGFGLVANGARRIRQESAQIIAASREARQLEPLVDAIIYLNVLARDEAEQMQQVSGECVDMLKNESTNPRKSQIVNRKSQMR